MGAAQQGDEADEGKRIGALQLIPSVRRTAWGSHVKANERKRLAFGPALLVLVASVSGAQERVRNPPFALPDSVRLLTNVTYLSSGPEAPGLDLFLPRDATGPFPAIVFVACGGWNGGAKADFWRQSAFLAERGFVAASTECRPSRVAPFPDQLNDLLEAVGWLRRHAADYRVDTERIAVGGASAGGHLAALVAMNAWNGSAWAGTPAGSRVQAAIAFNPVLDLTGFSASSLVWANLVKLLGTPSDRDSTRWRDASPINHVSCAAAPVLLLHGTEDATVPLSQSQEMLRRLQMVGVTAELFLADGAGHGFFKEPPWFQPTLVKVTEFLSEVFRLRPPKPVDSTDYAPQHGS